MPVLISPTGVQAIHPGLPMLCPLRPVPSRCQRSLTSDAIEGCNLGHGNASPVAN